RNRTPFVLGPAVEQRDARAGRPRGGVLTDRVPPPQGEHGAPGRERDGRPRPAEDAGEARGVALLGEGDQDEGGARGELVELQVVTAKPASQKSWPHGSLQRHFSLVMRRSARQASAWARRA